MDVNFKPLIETLTREFPEAKFELNRLPLWQKFFEAPHDPYAGVSSLDWLHSLKTDLPEKYGIKEKLNREQLLIQSRDFCDLTYFVAVMAWGGMRRPYMRSILNDEKNKKTLIKIVNEIRDIKTTRYDAYYKFFNATQNGLDYIGPAFYTKLLFFRPAQDAYIMDQWLVKSLHVLAGNRDFFPLIGNSVPKNTLASDYEKFCRIIDTIALYLKWSGSKVEEHLFSKGKKGRILKEKLWRDHVAEEWEKLA